MIEKLSASDEASKIVRAFMKFEKATSPRKIATRFEDLEAAIVFAKELPNNSIYEDLSKAFDNFANASTRRAQAHTLSAFSVEITALQDCFGV